MSEEAAKEAIVEEGVHNYSAAENYVKPQDPAILEKLEWFMDQKLAFMMHFGIYSQQGIVESWALIDEDEEWSRNEIDWTNDIDRFKDDYVHLNRSFNPLRLEPDKWAKAAKDAGFRYLIFTTKHHDGFCLWDTKTTDYKVTAPDCPFHANPKADIVKETFDAFRKEGLGIAAYFSKADWNCPYFWKPGYLHSFTARGPSYDPSEDPETWERFVQFTHQQLRELANDYGPLDILWFDAGWVRPDRGQDIRLSEIMTELRKNTPDLLSADRTVGGPYENYITPEQCVPEEPLFVPWESCITLGYAFSYRFADRYKSLEEVLRLLLSVVAKGGNLALNIAPQPDGRLPEPALLIMKELGQWLKVHGEGIYETRPVAPYEKDGFFFTRNRRTGHAYAFCFPSGEAVSAVTIPWDGPLSAVTLLETGEKIPFERSEQGIRLRLELSETPLTLSFRLEA